MTIATTMCKLLLAMVIGFFLFKKGILNTDTNKKISAMIVQVTCPCIILNSVSSVPHDDPGMVLKLFLAGVVLYVILPFLSLALVRLMRVPEHLRRTYMCMLIFSNNSFMGYPVVEALFGGSAIFYITIFNLPFSILFFSLGLRLLKKDSMVGQESAVQEKISIKSLINAGVVASLAALIIYFGNIPMPDMFYSCVSFIGGITTPLSMIIIGSSLAAVSLKEIKTEKGIWPMLPLRLVLMPVLVWLYMHLITKDPTLIGICTVGAGMPVASLVAMGAAPYERQSTCASIGVAVSTIVSLITIPIMAVILQMVA